MQKDKNKLWEITAILFLFYAYLYLLGFLYLLSYFQHWGLYVIEFKFSVFEIATFVIFPMVIVTIYFLLPFFSVQLNAVFNRNYKDYFMVFIYLLTLASLILIVFNFQFNKYKVPIFFAVLGYFSGSMFYYRKDSKICKCLFYMLTGCLIIITLMLALHSGKNYAQLEKSYCFDPFSSPSDLRKVEVCLNKDCDIVDLNGLRENEKENKYKGLLLLIESNDTYYLIIDKSVNKIREKYSKEEYASITNKTYAIKKEKIKSISFSISRR